jgi:hypothetical protein
MVDNHTYTLSAPDPFVAPYFDLLLDRTQGTARRAAQLLKGRVPGLTASAEPSTRNCPTSQAPARR